MPGSQLPQGRAALQPALDVAQSPLQRPPEDELARHTQEHRW